MMRDIMMWVAVIVVCILGIVIVLIVVRKSDRCDATGGVLVRGAFGYECVQRAR